MRVPGGAGVLAFDPSDGSGRLGRRAALACRCDVNGDRAVGFEDVLSLLSAWGACGGPCPADITLNEDVGFEDLLMVLDEYGAVCGPE